MRQISIPGAAGVGRGSKVAGPRFPRAPRRGEAPPTRAAARWRTRALNAAHPRLFDNVGPPGIGSRARGARGVGAHECNGFGRQARVGTKPGASPERTQRSPTPSWDMCAHSRRRRRPRRTRSSSIASSAAAASCCACARTRCCSRCSPSCQSAGTGAWLRCRDGQADGRRDHGDGGPSATAATRQRGGGGEGGGGCQRHAISHGVRAASATTCAPRAQRGRPAPHKSSRERRAHQTQCPKPSHTPGGAGAGGGRARGGADAPRGAGN